MKRYLMIVAMLVAVLAVPALAEEKTYPGPQEAAPNIYHQIFDNDRVRVSEITFKPGDKAAMHTHPYVHFVYVMEGGTLTLSHPDGTFAAVTAKAGEVLWMSAETHEAVNTGTTVVRGLVTELK
jgi:quercetin dioxygenase-like cupin family protein